MQFRGESIGRVCVVGLAALLPVLLGPGCPTASQPQNDLTVSDLTEAQRDAIDAAVQAVAPLARATNTAQSATAGIGASQQTPPGDLSFGTCPAVSTSGDLAAGAASVTVDFGSEPCTVLSTPDFDYVCSGSATGTLNLLQSTLSVQFNQVQCNTDSLNGSADVSVDVEAIGSGTAITLAGAWDLDWSVEGEAAATEGNGTCTYNTATTITGIPTFTGSFTDDDETWSIEVTNVLVSFAAYGSYIPYSGTVTVTGASGDTITVEFDANSPTTGDVQVRVNNSPTLTVNLYDL